MKARDIWTVVKGAGWDAAIAKYKPDRSSTPKSDVTVGEFLAEIEKLNSLRLRTFLNYANCFRTIIAEVVGIAGNGRTKFDYRTGGNREWKQKIDSIQLSRLTPELVSKWQRDRIARAGRSELTKASARRTCNSYVRCARSLFSSAITKRLTTIRLPDVLPFYGVELLETGSMKYISRLNVEALIAAAKAELKSDDPEAYKAFLLALFAGMRKGEIDLAEWSMVDLAGNVIRLQPTEWLRLKTRDSAAPITVDPEVLAELREFKGPDAGVFILKSSRKPKEDSARPFYRCDDMFNRLTAWLRGKGVNSNKPLHELRKEIGAIVATKFGIFAASRYLRHSDITTTARHYADHKERINVGLGKLLDTSIHPVEPRTVKNPR